MPTLSEHAQAQVERLTTERDAAKQAFAASASAYSDAQAAHRQAVADYVDAESTLEAVRDQLGLTEVAAALTPLSGDLRAAIVALREADAALTKVKVDLVATETVRELAKARADELAQALVDARAVKAKVEQRAATVQAWVDATAVAPFDTLVADATALKASAAYTDAQTKITNAMPPELLTRAQARLSRQIDEEMAAREHVDDLLEPLFTSMEANDGLSGAVPRLERALDNADEALRVLVATSAARLAEAAARLEAISKRPTIADAVRDALADVTTLRGEAASREADLDAAKIAAAEALRAYQVAKVGILVADPDADPELDTTFGLLSAANETVSNAEDDYGPTLRLTMAEWQAEVPASVWSDLYEFELATRLLDQLASLNISAGAGAPATAELALVAALEAELDSERGHALASELSETAKATHTDARNTRELRYAAALRGLL